MRPPPPPPNTTSEKETNASGAVALSTENLSTLKPAFLHAVHACRFLLTGEEDVNDVESEEGVVSDSSARVKLTLYALFKQVSVCVRGGFPRDS